MELVIITHPLVQHKITLLRDTSTGTKEFREIVGEISTILCYEALRDAPLSDRSVQTPICTTIGKVLDEDHYVFVPILRAGLAMVDGVLSLIPNAKIGHIGMYRNEETAEPVNYYFKVPNAISDREVVLLDPMLATGGSAVSAISFIKNAAREGASSGQTSPVSIKFLSIIAAPEGVAKLKTAHPDVQIYTAALDEQLNEKHYIVPGLGDAGDRIFGTK